MTVPARPLVVIAGKINPAGVAQLESEARVVITPDQEPKTVIELAREAEAILFRAGPRCDDAILGACPHVRVVGRHGVGLDTVDLEAATRHGVAVVHAPGSNSQAVAEHALMLMLACVKRTVEIDRLTRKGDWRARHEVGNTELGREDPRHRGRRQHRPAGRSIRRRDRDARPRLRQVRPRRGGPPARRRARREPGGALAPGRRAHLPHAPDPGDAPHDRRAGARPAAPGRDLHQHVARSRPQRAGGLRGPRPEAAQRRGPRRVRAGAEPGRQPDLQPRQRRVLGPRRRGDARGEPRGLPPGDGGDPARPARGAASRPREPRRLAPARPADADAPGWRSGPSPSTSRRRRSTTCGRVSAARAGPTRSRAPAGTTARASPISRRWSSTGARASTGGRRSAR